MEEKNCKLLFEYLRSILYDSEVQTLDISLLDQPYQQLGQGLQLLEKSLSEMKSYLADLSIGNLSRPFPSQENFLCFNLKNLHANLNHLTWQAKQVADGDYSQRVCYLGEFSDAFNTMTAQLRERERQLKKEALEIQNHAEVIESYNKILMEMMRKKKEWAFVVDAETKKVIYCNKTEDQGERPGDICLEALPFYESMLKWSDKGENREWQVRGDGEECYQITSFSGEWRGSPSYFHVVSDATQDKLQIRKLTDQIDLDPDTGIYNRLFFKKYMAQILQDRREVTLCYLDLDGLKAVNDQFGHLEGDTYIKEFIAIVKKNIRKEDVFARVGGDEFCIVFLGYYKSMALRKLARIREKFIKKNKKPYPVSFSYGVFAFDNRGEKLSLDEIIGRADSAMYQYKQKNKKKSQSSK
ncbi:MAG: GGDEF domain-containing protein [Lachnospiraceae bacterium]|nr:GGDEF domain-containing protein [Robinsoniella sp.]MDY3766612.1 GGDEF domain-containing protein [Lachnospiraceae bacterium]